MTTEDRLGDTSVLETLFRHNAWANRKLLDYCAGLSDDQLEATAVGVYGPIRRTLVHLVGAEVDYVHRATGKWPEVDWPEDRFPGFETLKEAARWAGGELAKLAVNARADALVREELPEEHAAVEYPLSSLLVQAINHATEHRTQISAIITQLGLEPPDMAGWEYMVEAGEFREWRTE